MPPSTAGRAAGRGCDFIWAESTAQPHHQRLSQRHRQATRITHKICLQPPCRGFTPPRNNPTFTIAHCPKMLWWRDLCPCGTVRASVLKHKQPVPPAGTAAEDGACCQAGWIWENPLVPLFLPRAPTMPRIWLSLLCPGLAQQHGVWTALPTIPLGDGQAGLELVPGRSQAQAPLEPGCCRGRGAAAGDAEEGVGGPAAWAGSHAPHGPQGLVIQDNRRRGAGWGLSCHSLWALHPKGLIQLHDLQRASLHLTGALTWLK